MHELLGGDPKSVMNEGVVPFMVPSGHSRANK